VEQSVCWKLLVYQLVKKFPSFYGTRNFVAALNAVRHFAYREPDGTSSRHANPLLFFAPSA
jgi:hypothetical protein